jgi:serine/threonine-protein kinase RsbW
MRESIQDGCYQLAIPSDPREARCVQEMVEQELRSHHFDDRDIFKIKLALEEALVNAIKHGNQMDPSKKVYVQFNVNRDRFEVRIDDEGKGFALDDVPDPKAPENLERPCGRGLLLMRHYMTEVTFHAPGNRLTMCKVREHNGQPVNGNGRSHRSHAPEGHAAKSHGVKSQRQRKK